MKNVNFVLLFTALCSLGATGCEDRLKQECASRMTTLDVDLWFFDKTRQQPSKDQVNIMSMNASWILENCFKP